MTRCNINQLATAYKIIDEHPGEMCGSTVARKAGVNHTYFYKSVLHLMEEHGFLLSQDERGKLYPFCVRRDAQEILEARQHGKISPFEIVKVPTARMNMR